MGGGADSPNGISIGIKRTAWGNSWEVHIMEILDIHILSEMPVEI